MALIIIKNDSFTMYVSSNLIVSTIDIIKSDIQTIHPSLLFGL